MSKEQSSAEKAMQELDKAAPPDEEQEEVPEQETQEESEESTEEPEKEDSEEDSEEIEDNSNAINFYKQLNDPEMGPVLVEALAKRMGLKIEGASRQEQKTIIDSIDELVSEELGPDFKIFSGKLSNVLKKLVPEIARQTSSGTEAKLHEIEQRRIANEAKNALDSVLNSYESVPKNVEKAMLRIMEEMPPTPGKTDPTKYFKRLINLAASETSTKLVPLNGSSHNAKTVRNQRDASAQLASKRTSEVSSETRSSQPKFKDRRAAIEQAMKDLEKAGGKTK